MFTVEALQAMIRQEFISEQYPYSEQDDRELYRYVKPLIAELERGGIRCKVGEDHFDSGYASYIQLFIYEDAAIVEEVKPHTRSEDIYGFHVLISRLAPVAVIGNANEWGSYSIETGESRSGGRSMISTPQDVKVDPPYEQLANTLERMLMKYQFTILRQEDLDAPLPFEADIPTIFREKGQYLVWDAVNKTGEAGGLIV